MSERCINNLSIAKRKWKDTTGMRMRKGRKWVFFSFELFQIRVWHPLKKWTSSSFQYFSTFVLLKTKLHLIFWKEKFLKFFSKQRTRKRKGFRWKVLVNNHLPWNEDKICLWKGEMYIYLFGTWDQTVWKKNPRIHFEMDVDKSWRLGLGEKVSSESWKDMMERERERVSVQNSKKGFSISGSFFFLLIHIQNSYVLKAFLSAWNFISLNSYFPSLFLLFSQDWIWMRKKGI